jgi:phosphatidylglycerol lysyltransferase
MKQTTRTKIYQKLTHYLPAIVFICALVIVQNQLKSQNIDDIVGTLKATPSWIVLIALILTFLNYLILAAYDGLALYFTGHTKIPLPKVIAAALLSYSISNNTGHAWAAGGSIRYRFYSKWGVPGWDIVKISLFLAITYLLGALSLGFIGSLLLPLYSTSPVHDSQAIYWISVICGTTLLSYLAAVKYWRKPVKVKGFELFLPSLRMTFWQTVVSSIDIILSSVVLWVLLVDKVDIGFSGFVMVFVVAQVAGVISQVPGGIGVFEGAFLWLMSDIEGADQHAVLIGALMLFRIIYFIIPLVLAGAGLFGYEALNNNRISAKQKSTLYRLFNVVLTKLYACYLFIAGAVLILLGLVEQPEALAAIEVMVPSIFTTMSPFASLLLGLMLMFLSRGIRLKINAAWHFNQFLLAFGFVISSFYKFSWQEASFFMGLFFLMLPIRSYCSRTSSLIQMFNLKHKWITSVSVFTGTVLFSLLAYADGESVVEIHSAFLPVNLSSLMWLPLLTLLAPYSFALWRISSVAAPRSLTKPTLGELAEAQKILAQSTDTQGFLALLGDKYLLWNEERSAFIMFGVSAKFWVALSNPIGEPKAFKNLLRNFQAQADQYGAKPVFYRVSTEMMPYYLDLGLSFYKLGEEAKISLPAFTLQGKQLDAQRNRRNKFNKMGFTFEILTGEALERAMPCLRRISDAWMTNKNVQEKGFSLGYFDEDYLRLTDVAVIKDDTGVIRAFANLWHTAYREELAIDLMRYDPNTQKGIMDFLFVELMLWGKAENYQSFSMGLAPLAGLDAYPLATLWHKVGAGLFNLGDHFYNFKGLHEYKSKYAPSWEARYLAAPSGFSVPFIMISISFLISGGWHGVFTKLPDLKKLAQDNFGFLKGLTRKQSV